MNDTKWEEVRLAMFGLGELRPRWRSRDVQSGYVSPWDGDWFYHFRVGGYATVEWVELRIESAAQDALVLDALRAVHVPGERIEGGFRVYGYARGPVDYL